MPAVMPRKSVRALLSSIRGLRRSVKAQRHRLSRSLAGRPVAPAGAGQAYPVVLAHLEEELEALASMLTGTENRYLATKQRARDARRRRDREVAAMEEVLRPFQRFLPCQVNTRPSDSSDAALGAYSLAQEASKMVELLKRLEREPARPVHGVSIDARAAGSALASARDDLEAVLTELAASESDVAFIRDRTDAAVAHAKSMVRWVQRAFEGLSGLARLDCDPSG